MNSIRPFPEDFSAVDHAMNQVHLLNQSLSIVKSEVVTRVICVASAVFLAIPSSLYHVIALCKLPIVVFKITLGRVIPDGNGKKLADHMSKHFDPREVARHVYKAVAFIFFLPSIGVMGFVAPKWLVSGLSDFELIEIKPFLPSPSPYKRPASTQKTNTQPPPAPPQHDPQDSSVPPPPAPPLQGPGKSSVPPPPAPPLQGPGKSSVPPPPALPQQPKNDNGGVSLGLGGRGVDQMGRRGGIGRGAGTSLAGTTGSPGQERGISGLPKPSFSPQGTQGKFSLSGRSFTGITTPPQSPSNLSGPSKKPPRAPHKGRKKSRIDETSEETPNGMNPPLDRPKGFLSAIKKGFTLKSTEKKNKSTAPHKGGGELGGIKVEELTNSLAARRAQLSRNNSDEEEKKELEYWNTDDNTSTKSPPSKQNNKIAVNYKKGPPPPTSSLDNSSGKKASFSGKSPVKRPDGVRGRGSGRIVRSSSFRGGFPKKRDVLRGRVRGNLQRSNSFSGAPGKRVPAISGKKMSKRPSVKDLTSKFEKKNLRPSSNPNQTRGTSSNFPK